MASHTIRICRMAAGWMSAALGAYCKPLSEALQMHYDRMATYRGKLHPLFFPPTPLPLLERVALAFALDYYAQKFLIEDPVMKHQLSFISNKLLKPHEHDEARQLLGPDACQLLYNLTAIEHITSSLSSVAPASSHH